MFSEQCMGERYSTWQPITTEELCVYMGFMILMGVVKLPAIYDYWRKDTVYHYSPVASRISRDHFFELHRYLHFTDNPLPCSAWLPRVRSSQQGLSSARDDWGMHVSCV